MSDNKINEVVDEALGEVKKILGNKKNKTAAIGATAGYILSKNNRERNAVLGGLVGYLLSGDEEEE